MKREEGLFIVCLNIFAGFVFIIMLRFISHKSKIEYKEWDMDTVTVSDFAVETKIDEDMFNNFKRQFQPKVRRGEIEGVEEGEYSIIYEFQKAIIKSLQEQIMALPVINKQLRNVEINQINF